MTVKRPAAPMRTLMGPGPLDIHPNVYRALASPVIGHLDPAYVEVLDQIRERLRMVFQTENHLTQASPGTGTSGMEMCVANMLEPGDRVLCCVHGYFGDRIRQMAERQDADVTVLESEWGMPDDPARIEAALKDGGYKVITLVHAETSTGVLQPMDDVVRLAKSHGAKYFSIRSRRSAASTSRSMSGASTRPIAALRNASARRPAWRPSRSASAPLKP